MKPPSKPKTPLPLKRCCLLRRIQQCLGLGLDWHGTKTIRLPIPHKRGLRFFVPSKINSWESAAAACAVLPVDSPGPAALPGAVPEEWPKERQGRSGRKSCQKWRCREEAFSGLFLFFFPNKLITLPNKKKTLLKQNSSVSATESSPQMQPEFKIQELQLLPSHPSPENPPPNLNAFKLGMQFRQNIISWYLFHSQ